MSLLALWPAAALMVAPLLVGWLLGIFVDAWLNLRAIRGDRLPG